MTRETFLLALAAVLFVAYLVERWANRAGR